MSNNACGLRTTSGESIALKSVEIDVRIEGWILIKTLRQRYRNDTQNNLEVVYSFPLAYDETLLSMNATLDDKRLEAQIMERKEAAESYEKAIEKGDAPILVEIIADGIASVNLGSVAAGAEVSLKIVSAVALRFVREQIRVTLPSTIAPRYGDPIAQGGLKEHNAIGVDPLVEYPLNIRIELIGEAANAAISSPSHNLRIKRDGETTVASLADKAFMDRDFILILDEIKQTSAVLVAPDGDEFAAIATFYPRSSSASQPVRLKILVDCSGSMNGDSIRSAKRALRRIASELDEADFVSYSRFGSTTAHDFSSPRPCSTKVLGALNAAIEATNADLGGTETKAALLEVFKLGAQDDESSNVLLITDGETWDVKEIIKTAKKSAHRVFVVGIGAAAAETFLRDLAEQSGGSYEAIAPNEDGENAIARMFYRMRGGALKNAAIDWFQTPAWSSDLPRSVYGGETLRVFAKLKAPPSETPRLSYAQSGENVAIDAPIVLSQDSIVSRLVAARRIKQTDDAKERLNLALNYRLLTDETALFLVHELAQKSDGTPMLHQVPQQLAAGWGGYGRVSIHGQASIYAFAISGFACYRLGVTRGANPLSALPSNEPDRICIEQDIDAVISRYKSDFCDLYFKISNYVNVNREIEGERLTEITAERLLAGANFVANKQLDAKLCLVANKHKNTLGFFKRVYRKSDRQIADEYKVALGQTYIGAGEIIAVAYIGDENDPNMVLLGYDANAAVLSVIALKTPSETLLKAVIKCSALSGAVNRKKLLSDLNLPPKTKIAPAVLADNSIEFQEETNRPAIAKLIAKLGVTIALK
ncbi:MAG: VIT and VWA domain-containing protein [Helicobacteraceae bacterium]|jgi:Ca-activated chloride channel family protein|nr:VIT and VWA domain-containing protein [Helicobacteraceae bacterium]